MIRLFVIELASFLSSSSSFIFIFFKFLVVSACLYTRNRLFGHPGREPCRPYNPGRRPDQQFFSLFLWPVAQITREKGENKSRRPFVCRVGFALFLLLSTWRWIYPNTRTHIQAQGGLPYQEKSISVISSISGTLGEEQLYYFYIDNSSHELNNSHSPIFYLCTFYTRTEKSDTHWPLWCVLLPQ